jgi:hypothetical protein
MILDELAEESGKVACKKSKKTLTFCEKLEVVPSC